MKTTIKRLRRVVEGLHWQFVPQQLSAYTYNHKRSRKTKIKNGIVVSNTNKHGLVW